MTRSTLGELEELVLLTLLRLGGRSYTVPVAEELEAATGRSVSPTAIYMVFRRLEKRGFLTSEVGESTHDRGGRAPRIFTVQDEALPLLRESRDARRSLWEGLDGVLGTGR